jgi:ribosomal protein S18 acetylase RimI-like enzyme
VIHIEHGFTDADRPQIAALYWEAFGAKLGRAMGPRDKALIFFHDALNPSHAICARAADGQLLGVAGFKTIDGALVDGTLSDMARVYGWLGATWRVTLLAALERDTENARFLMDGIFVAPTARGQGVGTELLAAVTAEARRRGYSEVRLDVIDGNDRARALYERQGFLPIGTQSTGLLHHIFGFRSATTMVRQVS